MKHLFRKVSQVKYLMQMQPTNKNLQRNNRNLPEDQEEETLKQATTYHKVLIITTIKQTEKTIKLKIKFRYQESNRLQLNKKR